MKYLIVILLIPIALFSRPPQTATLGDCSDGTKRTVTYIDSDNNGSYDKTIYRYCDGQISNKPLKMTLTAPPIPPVFSVNELENNNCSQSGVNIDLRYHILDSNGIITHEVTTYCNNDTTYISEYIIPPMLKQEVLVGTVVSFEKENMFTNLNDFFIEQKNRPDYEVDKKFEVILIDNNNKIFQRTFYANSTNFKEIFYNNIKKSEIGEKYLIEISSEGNNFLIRTED